MKQKKKGLKERILALSLAGILCFGSVPQSVYASESSDEDVQETTQSDQISEETAEDIETGNTEPEIVIPGAVRLKEAATPEDMAKEAKTEVAKHTRLIVVSESDLMECYGATECICGYGNLHILTYEDATTCENAYVQFTATGMSVEYDETVEAYEEETEEAKSIEETLEDTNKETKAEEQGKATTEKKEEKQEIVVAVIDTGADSSSKILKGRIKDNGYIPNTNGHGTLMAEIIASNTGEEVKILPIQAFDENGKGTVSTTYLAMMEAIEKKADIINLSVSGEGTSPMLASAIRQAKEAGIPVIVSAGNNGADTTDYMPGNITEALTVSAVTENKEAAAYSNHGKEVDFCAIGTVTKDNGTKDTSDDVTYEGTSVSAAYLTAYAAMILEENPQADVEACLKESAEDLGKTGWDSFYGYGYISRENLISNIEREENKETEESEDESKKDDVTDIVTEEDGGQELAVSADIKNKEFWIYNLGPRDITHLSFIGIRDSDSRYESNWNNLNLGNVFYAVYPTANGGCDLMVTMSCDVTDWTPYLEITTTKTGYRPTGWTDLYSSNPGMNQSWYDNGGHEVHNLNDRWVHGTDGYYFRLYIGAGFAMDHMTVQWGPVGYHINHDMNGATYIDQNTLNYLNNVEYGIDTLYGVPDANTFANKYNRVNYNASGGTCVSGNTGGSYDHGYSTFLGWDDNTVVNTINGLLYDCYGYQSVTTFNAAYYANIHPDLMAGYGYDKKTLWNHYCNHGVYEGRSIRSGHILNNLDSNDLYVPGGQRAFCNLTDSGKTTTLTARWKDPVVKLPTPTRTGYTFTGWYTASGSYVGKGGTSYTVSGTGTLYARWTPNTYYIDYDGNGADEGSMNRQTVTYDTTVKLKENAYAREGYAFTGWNTKPDGSGTSYADKQSIRNLSSKNGAVINLYAQWKEHTYTLVFDGNGADIGSMESLTVHYTDTLTLPKNLYENTTIPCTYMGWIHDKDALKADYGDEEELEVKKIIKKAGKEAEDGATITLYAFWDIAPVIEAKDWYIGKEMAENMTEEQLLERAKSTDREDGDLERGKELVVVDFDKEDFLHLGQIGSCTVTFQATDSAGNITYKDIKVEVSEDRWLDMPYYTRFISEEFYGKKPESGGCVDGSVWNEIPEYKQELTDAFARINNDTGVITYVFERDDIKASHDFTEAHGFGEYEEDRALNLWLDAFAHCREN
ncbi:MAG: S8 family serine peptidase [Lachnospiraceae bacterium]|nr:S8 family serine peptidase [Lachnospiraceae bacterium]MDD7377801.1 S8 family serine peptidase [Lachnospiraceae bacterium]MDY4616138.1 S8 family serine peptidase [Lachnospiraceae bacterium]